MAIVATLTEDIRENIVADVAEDIGAALLVRGLITADEKADVVGSINCLGNVAIKAYFASKAK